MPLGGQRPLAGFTAMAPDSRTVVMWKTTARALVLVGYARGNCGRDLYNNRRAYMKSRTSKYVHTHFVICWKSSVREMKAPT